MNKEKKRKKALEKELKEYEKVTPMSKDERSALRKWVKCGNSVHENGDYVCDEHGRPADFLDVYRHWDEEYKIISGMSEREREQYLDVRYRGVIKAEPAPALSYEELKDKVRRLYKKNLLYWLYITSAGLQEEALEYMEEHVDDELVPFDIFD